MFSETPKKRLFLAGRLSWRNLLLVFFIVCLIAIATIVGSYRSYPFLSFDDLYGDLSFLPTNRQWRWDEQWTFITPSKLAPEDAYILEGAKAIRSQIVRCGNEPGCGFTIALSYYDKNRLSPTPKFSDSQSREVVPNGIVESTSTFDGYCEPYVRIETHYWCTVSVKYGNYVIDLDAVVASYDNSVDLGVNEFWGIVHAIDAQTSEILGNHELSVYESTASYFNSQEPWEELRNKGRR